MQESLDRGPARKYTLEDTRKFGNLLKASVDNIGQLSRSVAIEALGVNNKVYKAWEDGEFLPDKDRLPEISRILQIDKKVLDEAYDTVFYARKYLKGVRNSPKPRKADPDDSIYGDSSPRGGTPYRKVSR